MKYSTALSYNASFCCERFSQVFQLFDNDSIFDNDDADDEADGDNDK